MGEDAMGQAKRRATAQKEREVHIDQRRSARAPLEIRVDYSTVDALFCDFTSNINEGGLFIETSDPCPVDTVVKLQFRLPGIENPVRTRGRVVWVGQDEPSGMGIEFEDLDAAARARINHAVRCLRNDPS
jgi:type IV pilus assembly protein PilZ